MIIFPAIDLINGKVVRLSRGEFDQVTEYGDDPTSVAQQFEAAGAKWIHVIDLDGAKTGSGKNRQAILKIAKKINIPVQTGGGVRSQEDVEELINAGIQRAILGTRAVENLSFLSGLISKWQDKIAVSLDCKNGFVTQKGWTETSETRATDLAGQLEMIGIRCLIYTDIATDGMLTGPNYQALEEMLKASNIPLIASGGIASIQDIEKLKTFESKGLIGAITGKALYEGKLDLKEALSIC